MPFDRDASIRELQLASLPDIQGSIQANDNKSAAALVVHGLLFAGLVSIIANLHDVFDDATLGAKIAGAAFLVGAAVSFALSVLALIDAAQPHDPKSTRDLIKHRYTGAFFPPADPEQRPPGGARGLDDQLDRLAALKTGGDFQREYAAEQIKLADIRVTQAAAAKNGFRYLTYELAFVGLFLALLALVSVDTPHVAHADEGEVRLQMAVDQGGRRLQADASGVVHVGGRRPISVAIEGSGGELSRLELAMSMSAGCGRARRRGRAQTPVPLVVDHAVDEIDRDDASDGPLRLAQIVTPPRCGRRRVQMWAALRATADAPSTRATRQLVLRAR